MVSFFQFDPSDPAGHGDPEVEAMPAALAFDDDEGRFTVRLRGKPGDRYEREDSVWLEFEEADALALIERMAAGLARRRRGRLTVGV